ncbi:MAG: PP2C family protein-serine/threonine phosphatase [Acidobacteria bacterium]|nr:PP2C family protein-serine/threonine phosphatase [Acidobacteriota bacterium]
MQTHAPGTPDDPRLWDQLKDDFRGFGDDVRSGGFWATIRRTFEDLESFYLSDEYRLRLQELSRFKRFFVRLWWLLKSLFLKLSPARRVMLIVALVFLVSGRMTFSTDDGRTGGGVDVPLLSGVLLLLLLMLELKDKLVARHELAAGRAVQRALMPEGNPTVPGWDVWLYTMPANDVGGDLVDHLEVEPGRHAMALADVAGKALPAALLMAKVQSTLRALATEASSLEDLASRVNTILCRDGLPNRFVTLVYLDVHANSGHVTLVNAGHMPPIVLSTAGFHDLPRGNIAMGLMPRATFEEQRVELQPGEMLVVYSDGLTDAMNASGEFYGDERLRALMPGLAALTSADAGARLLSSVSTFINNARPYDDISLVILKRTA